MSLTDEILEKISDYRMEPIEAEANVIKAHMEACLRDIQIQEECSNAGIIMEGDIIPERGDENIFKYIFLFIPRLIMNLMRKLREWITGTKEPTAAEIQEVREETENQEFCDTVANRICAMVNKALAIGKTTSHSSGKMIWDSSSKDYCFMWRIKDVKILEDQYDAYHKMYETYGTMFDRLIAEQPITVNDEFMKFHMSTVKDASSIGIKVLSDTPENRLPSSAFTEEMSELRKTLKSKAKEIEDDMKDVIKKWDKLMKGKDTHPQNIDLAREYRGTAQRMYAEFNAFNTIVIQELHAGIMSFSKLIDIVKEPAVFKNTDMTDLERAKLKERGVI